MSLEEIFLQLTQTDAAEGEKAPVADAKEIQA
jgi:hypothetical protein